MGVQQLTTYCNNSTLHAHSLCLRARVILDSDIWVINK